MTAYARTVFINVDPVRCVSLPLGLLVSAALFLAACGSDATTDLSLPDAAPEVTTSAVDSQGITEEATSAPTSEPESSAGDTASTAEPAEEFVATTVRFDPDNPPDQAEFEDLVFAAVEADFFNVLWCWENADICNVERDLGPAIAEPRVIEINQTHSQFVADGALYRRSKVDAIYRSEVLASPEGEFEFGEGNQYRLLGAVRTCEVFGGPYFVPSQDGQSEEVLDDSAVSYRVEYRVWQDTTGVLRVAGRSFEQQEAVEDCDSLKG